jgi:gluconate 5-dehydrogenase
MREQGGGAIVNIVSATGQKRAHKGQAAYLASQAGLAGLTRAAAGELAEFNIRLNAICAGGTGLEPFAVRKMDAAALHKWRQAHPSLGLGGNPREVTLVLFLCSQAASSLTGQVWSLDQTSGS